VVGGEKLLKKKRSSKFFRMEILEVGLRLKKKVAKYSGQPRPETNFSVHPWGGGAKFISSPWAQKWLATALIVHLYSRQPGFKHPSCRGHVRQSPATRFACVFVHWSVMNFRRATDHIARTFRSGVISSMWQRVAI
jgi:hypothetical protein